MLEISGGEPVGSLRIICNLFVSKWLWGFTINFSRIWVISQTRHYILQTVDFPISLARGDSALTETLRKPNHVRYI